MRRPSECSRRVVCVTRSSFAGRDVDPAQQEAPYAKILVADRAADDFITYCTNAASAARRDPRLGWVRIPDDLDVGAVYGIGATMNAAPGGAGIVQFALGDQGRAILARFGFDGPCWFDVSR